jgi:hypothetical protein
MAADGIPAEAQFLELIHLVVKNAEGFSALNADPQLWRKTESGCYQTIACYPFVKDILKGSIWNPSAPCRQKA